MNLPFSQACENNKQPILAVLREVLNQPARCWKLVQALANTRYFCSRINPFKLAMCRPRRKFTGYCPVAQRLPQP